MRLLRFPRRPPPPPCNGRDVPCPPEGMKPFRRWQVCSRCGWLAFPPARNRSVATGTRSEILEVNR